MKIKTRFMLIPLSIIFLSLITLTIIVNIVIASITYNSINDKQEQLVESVSIIVDEYISEHINVINFLKDSDQVKDTSEYVDISLEYRGLSDEQGLPVRKLFSEVMAVYSNFAYLETFTPDRAINVVLEPYEAQLAISEADYSEGFWHRDWYSGAMNTKDTYVSEAYMSASIMEPVIAISSPIMDEANEINGILIGTLKLTLLSEVMSDLKFSESSINLIFDKNGHLVAHSDIDLLNRDQLVQVDDSLYGTILNADTDHSILEYDNKTVHFTRLTSSQWTIVSLEEVKEVSGPISNAIVRSLILMLVILFISLVILYINAHTTVLDIESLTNKIKSITINNISKVDIETFKKVTRDDEIGVLNESYIEMLIQLNQYSHEMESIIKVRTGQLSHANIELEVALEEVNAQKEMLEKNNSRLKESIKENKLMLQELSESKKMAALGSVVKGVAHEINTPLGNAVTTISYASSIIDKINSKLNDNKLGKDELDKSLIHLIEANQAVETNLSMIVNLIKNFKQMIGTENSHMIEVNMNDYVSNVLESYRNTSKSHYSYHVVCVEDMNMNLPVADMTLVLNNLISNSILHCEVSNLIIVVEIKVEDKQVKLFYRDNGNGIEASVQKEMFEPFVTSKRKDGHTGLGLHIVYNILNHNLNGKIEYSDGFIITLKK